MAEQQDDRMTYSGLSGKRILITGGSGYLAAGLTRLLKDVGCHVIQLDRDEKGLSPVDGVVKVERILGDVRERETWERALTGVDIVFHFAAQTSAYVANDDPLSDLHCNVMPMLHLLETSRRNGLRPIVLFSSTVTIAGIPTRLPVNETHGDHPMTIYDLHKLMAEQYLAWYVSEGFVKGATLRLANVYGPGPKSSSSDRGILNQMIRKAVTGKALTIYKPGDQIRDYVYVDDVVRAFVDCALSIEGVNGRYFVIGTGAGYTITEAMNLVADRVALVTGKRVDVDLIDPPSPQSAIESRNFVADSGRFHRATGWNAQHALPDGIDRTIEAFL